MQIKLSDYGRTPETLLYSLSAMDRGGSISQQPINVGSVAVTTGGPPRADEGLLYTAPEMLRTDGFGLESDMWSLGCLIARLVTIKPLFYRELTAEGRGAPIADPADEHFFLMMRIAAGELEPSSSQLRGEADLPDGLRELVGRCATFEPAERMSAAETHMALLQMGNQSYTGAGTVVPYSAPPPPARTVPMSAGGIASPRHPAVNLQRGIVTADDDTNDDEDEQRLYLSIAASAPLTSHPAAPSGGRPPVGGVAAPPTLAAAEDTAADTAEVANGDRAAEVDVAATLGDAARAHDLQAEKLLLSDTLEHALEEQRHAQLLSRATADMQHAAKYRELMPAHAGGVDAHRAVGGASSESSHGNGPSLAQIERLGAENEVLKEMVERQAASCFTSPPGAPPAAAAGTAASAHKRKGERRNHGPRPLHSAHAIQPRELTVQTQTQTQTIQPGELTVTEGRVPPRSGEPLLQIGQAMAVADALMDGLNTGRRLVAAAAQLLTAPAAAPTLAGQPAHQPPGLDSRADQLAPVPMPRPSPPAALVPSASPRVLTETAKTEEIIAHRVRL